MSSEGQAAEQVSTGGGAPNLIQRVMMVFFSPTKLGDALRSRSPWFWTLAILAIISVIIVLASPEELLLQAMQAQGRGGEGAELPSASMMRGIGVGTSLVGTFVMAAIVAGVLYLFINVFFGQAELTFKQHVSAVAHSWWIVTIGNLIQFALQMAKGDATMRLSLGLLLQEEPSTFVGFFLNNITIFGLWSAVALGLVESGLSAGKISAGKAITTIIVLYLLVAALFGATQGLGAG